MTSLILAALLNAAPAGLDETVRATLGSAGLNPETARFDSSILPFYRQGEFAVPIYEATYGSPWRTPFLMEVIRKQLTLSGGRPADTIGVVSRLIGDGASREFLGNPIAPTVEKAKRPRSFEAALNRMKNEGLIRGAIPSVDSVPTGVQQGAAVLIEAALDAFSYREAAFAQVPALRTSFEMIATTPPNSDNASQYQKQLTLSRQVEMSYLYAAAQEMGSAIVEARSLIGGSGAEVSFEFNLTTEWGQIRLCGRNVNRHDVGPIFVAIDTGGDDVWINPASNRSVTNWASFCLDMTGNDHYLSHAALKDTGLAVWSERGNHRLGSGPASARFGVTALLDVAGDDVYRTARPGLGSAEYGAALLMDLAGKDEYDAYVDGQGRGRFGIGLLEDGAGNDAYRIFSQGQAFGSVRGAGILLDRGGDDVYLANNEVLDFPSPQSADDNFSMAQGAASGFRSDYLNGRSQAGGFGLLLDQAGDDQYSCGVYGQGSGYWMGVGALMDGGGNDRYRGSWYVQGSGALFGIGFLEEFDGRDDYAVSQSAGLGSGFDFALGWLVDRGGDDVYRGATLCLGAAGENGFGIFSDLRGDDSYTSGGLSLGSVGETTKGSFREKALCLGVFLDLQGRDRYPSSSPWSDNDRRYLNWREKAISPVESQLGLFLDQAGQ